VLADGPERKHACSPAGVWRRSAWAFFDGLNLSKIQAVEEADVLSMPPSAVAREFGAELVGGTLAAFSAAASDE
jgi:hypothetical protein